MKRRIRCTKFDFSTISSLRVITTSMLNFWTGGGAIELVLESPKVGQVPIDGHLYKCANFHNFPIFPS